MTRVWIAYEPRVLAEAIVRVVQQIEGVELVENASQGVDVAIFRLAETGQLQDFFRRPPMLLAKMIVFSPRGDKAFIRQPWDTSWKEVTPFGLPQLIAEVRAGRGLPPRSKKAEDAG
jgi:hypothetical protein